MAPDSLLLLPNELLFHVARCLPRQDRYHWILTCRLFHNLVIEQLYLDEILPLANSERTVLPRPVSWALSTGNLATLSRARRMGAEPPYFPSIVLEAIKGANPAATVPYLLEHGADLHGQCAYSYSAVFARPDAWCMVEAVLDNCHQNNKMWCPVPVLQALLERGANVSTECGSGSNIMDLWLKIFTLEHVSSSPRRRSASSTTLSSSSRDVNTAHSPCVHTEPCRVAATKLLLQHGAKPEMSNATHTLVTLAMERLKRPVEIIECLADAGANLDGRFFPCVQEYCRKPRLSRRGRPNASINRAYCVHEWSSGSAPIHVAASNALLISSLARRPRHSDWDTWNHVTCPKAGDVVKFFLSHGVELDRRARTLLYRWDTKWMQWYVPKPHA